jgi:hypothetical protein
MNILRKCAVLSVLAMAAGTLHASKAELAQAQTTPGTAARTTTAPLFVLIPVELAGKDATMKSGCWAKVYDGENFTGDNLTVVGPVSLSDMSGPFGLNWDDKVNSIETGPKATVTVFDNEGFRDQVAQFKPSQKVADVSKKLGFFDEFASIRVACPK